MNNQDQIKELLDRPPTPFHEVAETEDVHSFGESLGRMTSAGALVRVAKVAGKDSLLLCFDKPLDDGTRSELCFGLTREAAESLRTLLSLQLQY